MFEVFLIHLRSRHQILRSLLKPRPAIHPAASGDAAVGPDKPPPGRAARPRPRKSVKRPPADEADVAGTDGGTAEQVDISPHTWSFHAFPPDFNDSYTVPSGK